VRARAQYFCSRARACACAPLKNSRVRVRARAHVSKFPRARVFWNYGADNLRKRKLLENEVRRHKCFLCLCKCQNLKLEVCDPPINLFKRYDHLVSFFAFELCAFENLSVSEPERFFFDILAIKTRQTSATENVARFTQTAEQCASRYRAKMRARMNTKRVKMIVRAVLIARTDVPRARMNFVRK
jgi:hypothetical protein